MHDFRFSYNVFNVSSRADFAGRCRLAEGFGYDTLFAVDHLGSPAPFPVLIAAAEATDRLRVGTMVLNAAFWNPALLAREVATVDVLTDGRLELGLGSGHMKSEFDTAGIPWEPFGARADRLAGTIRTLERCFRAGEDSGLAGGRAPQPVQRQGFHGWGPPLIVGGTGDRILEIAAEYADVVAVAGAFQVRGAPPGTFRLATAAEADERVRFARDRAGERADAIEWHALIQMVVETTDRRATAEQLAERFGSTMAADDILETPFLLLGTAEQMAERLRESRERHGFSYFTVHDPYMEAFAPVIEHLR